MQDVSYAPEKINDFSMLFLFKIMVSTPNAMKNLLLAVNVQLSCMQFEVLSNLAFVVKLLL